MPPRTKQKPEVEVQLTVTPGRWVPAGHINQPGSEDHGKAAYRWEEGTHQDLDDRHDYPHVIPRSATNLTTEHGSWEFVGLPDLPEGAVEARPETADSIQEEIARLTARRDSLRASERR